MKRNVVLILAVGLLIGLPAVAADELPPNAKPGECYARVFTPPVYSTSSERMTKQDASSRIEIVPARYEWTEQIVLAEDVVKGGRVELAAGTPITAADVAALRSGSGRLMTEKLEAVAARYDWTSEKVLVTPARTVWKEGRGPIERINDATGEIMCLIEEPAVYRTVRKKVETSPATTRTKLVPVAYKTLKIKRLLEPARERTIDIPATYETFTKKSLVEDGTVKWQSVLCQTNLNRNVVRDIQSALKRSGFNPGQIDGVIGQQTLSALRSFQKSKGLASGQITMETLEKLNVRISG